jgi:beta-lactamase superfamily II metal-dependent hydrolase
MFTVHALQAQYGDCLLIQTGAPNHHFVLIDGGPPRTYETSLAPLLEELVKPGGTIDLAVLSHIDNDHIVGLLDLFADLQRAQANGNRSALSIRRLWHNSFKRSLDHDGQIMQRLQTLMAVSGTAGIASAQSADAFLGIREGGRLASFALQLSVPLNSEFGGQLITVSSGPAIRIGSMDIHISGPTPEALDDLRTEWLEWLEEHEEQVMLNPRAIAAADRSIPNLSSIVMLIACEGKTALLTGDSRGDHIEKGLASAKLSKEGKLHVDLLKLPHHGSSRNITEGFFERITADRYLISANGRYNNPDFETLEMIVRAAAKAKRKIEIFATNETTSTRKLVRKLKPAQYLYSLTVCPKKAHSIGVVLAS